MACTCFRTNSGLFLCTYTFAFKLGIGTATPTCSDHDKFVVDKVTAHVTDPTLLFKVHYKDNNNSFSWLPFRDVKYLEQAKSYADKNKKDFEELRKLKWPDPNAATIGKRAKKGRGHTGSGYADMG